MLAAIGEARADAAPRAVRAPLAKGSAALAVKRAPRPSGPTMIAEERSRPGALVYAPRDPDERRVTVMLHGMCDEPEYECPYFAKTVTGGSWLLCPRATLRCDGGGSIWPWQTFERDIEASVERVAESHPGELDARRGRTLIGFSLGAIRGMDLAHSGGGRWPSVVLIGAKVHPDAARLRAAGAPRLLLAAGDYDMMKWQMAGEARRLVRQGYPAAFMSLGKIGHWFPSDFAERLERGLAWVHGDDAAFEPSALGEVAWRPPGTKISHFGGERRDDPSADERRPGMERD
jgi:predicted esterase